MTYCIYKITNRNNGKVYIGQHKYHENECPRQYMGRGVAINEAYRNEGRENFDKEIIEFIEDDVNKLNSWYYRRPYSSSYIYDIKTESFYVHDIYSKNKKVRETLPTGDIIEGTLKCPYFKEYHDEELDQFIPIIKKMLANVHKNGGCLEVLQHDRINVINVDDLLYTRMVNLE